MCTGFATARLRWTAKRISYSSSSGASYATTARTAASTRTICDARPGGNGPNVETEALNSQGTGVGAVLNGTDPIYSAIISVFTSRLLPSNFAGTTGQPGQANDGGSHSATNVLRYTPAAGDTLLSVVGVSGADMIAGTLSNAGVGYGTAQSLTQTNRAYVGSGGTMTTIAFGGSEFDALGESQANGVNIAGQVVGSSTFGGVSFFNSRMGRDDTHGFICQNGVLSELNFLLNASDMAKYTIISALSINDSGNILVAFDDGNATRPGFGGTTRFGLLTSAVVSSVP